MAHDQEVMGSNPGTIYLMDVSDLIAVTLKKKLKIKVAKWGTPKKIFEENKKKSKFETLA
jgi:hypothetical protein